MQEKLRESEVFFSSICKMSVLRYIKLPYALKDAKKWHIDFEVWAIDTKNYQTYHAIDVYLGKATGSRGSKARTSIRDRTPDKIVEGELRYWAKLDPEDPCPHEISREEAIIYLL